MMGRLRVGLADKEDGCSNTECNDSIDLSREMRPSLCHHIQVNNVYVINPSLQRTVAWFYWNVWFSYFLGQELAVGVDS